MRKQFRFGFAVALATIVDFSITSCDKEPADQRPELPPVESMMMDFSDFSEQPATAKGSSSSYQNFSRSYLTVGILECIRYRVSALPVAAYAHALQQTPVYLGDNTWEWSYDFSLNSVSYAATLTAMRISNQEFTVEMAIGFSDFSREWC